MNAGGLAQRLGPGAISHRTVYLYGLDEILARNKIQRIGKGLLRDLYRYFRL